VNVAELLAGGLPDPPKPTILRRFDGHCLFYPSKVNVLFGDPQSGKTWIADAAVAEVLAQGGRGAIIDVDHNGAPEIIGHLILLGADPRVLSDPDRFYLAEPGDGLELMGDVALIAQWSAQIVIVDSLGEIIPMLGLSSSSPDDYSRMHRDVLSCLADSGATVVAIDHLPKADEARSRGQTGTTAKSRAVNGATYRVAASGDGYAPGRGGASNLSCWKDRPGGVREHCPPGLKPPAGRFVMTQEPDGGLTWSITTPKAEDEVPDVEPAKGRAAAITDKRLAELIAELDKLDPPPRAVRDVQKRMHWSTEVSSEVLKGWKKAHEDDRPVL